MQVSVEKISNVERRLTITVPANQVEEAYTKQINQLAKNAKLKGFRPGKAPLSYIEQRYGEDARKEALNEVIKESLYQAIAKEKLKPVSTPRVEPKLMQPDQPLEFVASFEVLPDIEKIKFSMDHIEKLVVAIQPEDVDRVVSQIQKQYSKWDLVDRPAQEKDRVVIDYYAIFEGKSDLENKVENFPLELGSKMMFAGFEEGLIGAKTDEEKTLNLQFPADFQVQEKAGKPIDFVVKVKQIFAAEIQPMDEAFIKQLGIQSGKEEDLKQQIKNSLEQERDRLVKDKLKEQVFKQLFEQNPIDVPQSLVAREAKNIHDEIYQQQKGHDHGKHSEQELAAFMEMAKSRVSLGLLVAEYAKQNQLQADEERVQKRIQDIASAYEHPRDVIAWLSSNEQRGGIEAQILEDQVMEKLIEAAEVKEKVMSYAELKGIRI